MAKKPYLRHLKTFADLITAYEATRAGFIALALEKNRRATPFVEQARALKLIASTAKNPSQLLKMEEIQPALLTAAGISDKAAVHLHGEDKLDAMQGLIQNFLEPAGKDFVEELVYRYLLTRGDTLGGSMRNAGGAIAQRKLSRALISSLRISGRVYGWLHSADNQWLEATEDDADIELYLRGLSWQKGNQFRTLIFNLTVPIVRNNIDLCLLNCSPRQIETKIQAREIFQNSNIYRAFGELKGGIDPAGADEHWKTARTALIRIETSFARINLKPELFFVGAAIERKMAVEIWDMLENKMLSNAANLTDELQLASLAHWLCNI
ncbi:MAG TPA: AvaI/BsoBI family type II restriction endonuclease [Pyrinomonadaceae bacterium]|nr:AvaI/BsoBI family type II restriction endonuclease [Pyrinomonadaceae bacterium]